MLRVYRALLRLLPDEFRRAWLRDAEDDVRRALDRARRTRGALGAWAVGLRACADVLRTVPGEWWRIARAGRVRARDDGRRGTMMWNSLMDLRIAARSLARYPGFASVAVLTLACGIGANSAIFSVVNAVLLRPLPFPDADRLVAIDHHAPGIGMPDLASSPGMLTFYEEHGEFLQKVAGYRVQSRSLRIGGGVERASVIQASPALLEVLEVRPALGRSIVGDDADPGAAPVALLAHGFWVERFAGDPAVLGRTLRIDGVETELVGILPEGFAFPDPTPVALVPERDPARAFGAFGQRAVGRLAAGMELDDAQRGASELQALIPGFFGEDLGSDFLSGARWSVTVERLQDRIVGGDVASTLWVVLGTVGLVLLIACANVANLFLVRAESRRKEVAVRAALGASGGRIASVFLAEAWILGAAGGTLGLMVAWVSLHLLVARAPVELPRIHEIGIDGETVAFTVAVSFLTALVLGSLPLLRIGGRVLAQVLGEGGRGSTTGPERNRARSVLVSGQLALAVVLVVGCGLMLRSFIALRSVDAGVDPENVLVVGIRLGEATDVREGASFYQQVADAVGALPGVSSVGLTTHVPMGGGSATAGSFLVESRPSEKGVLPEVAFYKAIGADYIDAMGQRLMRGRNLERSDWEGGAPVALVNEAFAERFLGPDPLGQGVRVDEDLPFARVVGVLADVREEGLREEPIPWVYLPMVVGDWGYPALDQGYVVARMDGRTEVPLQAVREIVGRLDPDAPITSTRTMAELMAEQVAVTSFTLILLGLAAVMALFLGAIGLFGVISYVIGLRTREIGVRMALGARGVDIEAMIFRQASALITIGIALGLLAAGGLTRLMASLLYGVSTLDPLAFLGAPLLLGAIGLSAALVPARRASRIAPVEALRSE